MATLWKHPSGIWYVTWWDAESGRGRRKSTRTRDYAEAQAALADFRTDLLHGDGPVRRSTDLAPFARSFLRYQEERRTERHVADQRRQVKEFLESAPVSTVEAVRMEHVERFLGGLRRRGLAARTVNKYRGTLRKLFRRAQKRRLVRTNPVDLTEREPEDRVESDVLTHAEFLRALQHAEGTRIYVPLALAGLAGLRRGEVCALRWEDVDLDRRELIVRRGKGPKGRKDRVVEIGERLYRILDATPEEGVYVAVHRARRPKLGPWTPAALTHAVEALGRELRMRKLTGPQILRRSFGSWLAERDVPPLDIMRMMGHSSVVVTVQNYIRFFPGRRRAEIDEL